MPVYSFAENGRLFRQDSLDNRPIMRLIVAMDWNVHDDMETMELSNRPVSPRCLWLKAGALVLGRNESLVTSPQRNLMARGNT